MPTRSESRPTPIAPRPLASSEIAFRLDAILEDVARHTDGLPPRDDVTLVVVRGTALADPA